MKFNGLTDKEVEESRKKNGSNEIPDSEPTTFWQEFKETFSDPMIKNLPRSGRNSRKLSVIR